MMFLRLVSCGLLSVGLVVAEKYDLVVYGGTAGGAMTAIAAACEGLRVALLEPGDHIGGMLSGGLSRTDYGKKEVIGGYAREFYWRAGNYYGTRQYGQDEAWYHEQAWVEDPARHAGRGRREDLPAPSLERKAVLRRMGCE